MNTSPLRIAVVYPGDRETRRLATRENNRFSSLFAAFAAQEVDAQPAVYNVEEVDSLRDQLLALDGALVWVNPIESGRSRGPLDQLLREVADAGVFVSTHPDVIMKLGTKDVLVDTRDMGWGSEVRRLDTLEQLRSGLRPLLAAGSVRVLKQWRGHSGIGVWRVQALTADAETVVARHAQRGSSEIAATFDDFVALMAPYFENGGHMVDQAWEPRLTEGMVRCYLVEDRVQGFGLQAVNALYPAPDGASSMDAPSPGPRLYHPPNLPQVQDLKRRLEDEWVPELRRTLAIRPHELPILWDCDFLRGEPDRAGNERYVLCEINVSSVAPFPDSAIEPLVAAAVKRIAAARDRRASERRPHR